MTDSAHSSRDVGNLGEEAAKLFAAAADWAREPEHIATESAECRWCPVCQAIGLLRSASPEVREHVASLGVVARQLLDAVVAAAQDGSKPEPPSSPDVEHIDLSEGDSWD